MVVTVAVEAFDSPDGQRLVAALDRQLAAVYQPEQRFGPNLKPEQVAEGRGTFLIARVDGRAVGCGALRRLDDSTAELKRMYVDPDLRGQGIGTRILEELQASAVRMGVRRLVLETGIHQLEAIALYRRGGFTERACWGEYAGASTSLCFEKRLEDRLPSP